VQAGGVFAAITGGLIIGSLGYRWLGPILGPGGLLAAYLVVRAVPVDAGQEVEVESGSVITVEARPDRLTDAAASVSGK